MKTNEKNIHNGHRLRLLDTIYKSGIENVSNIQLVEFLCTFINPRQDVNPLAHRLLEHFGSYSNILDANYNQLLQVKGMTPTGAKKLILFKDLFNVYNSEKKNSNRVLSTHAAIYNYVSASLNYYDNESILYIGLDPNFRVIAEKKIVGDLQNEISIDLKDLAYFCALNKVTSLLVAHNHPDGNAFSSSKDVISTEKITKMCTNHGVNYVDHVILGKDQMFSMNKCIMFTLKDLIKPD